MLSTKQVVRVGQTYRLFILGLLELLDGHMRSSTFVHTAEDQPVGAFPDRIEHLVSLQESLSDCALDLSPLLIVELAVPNARKTDLHEQCLASVNTTALSVIAFVLQVLRCDFQLQRRQLQLSQGYRRIETHLHDPTLLRPARIRLCSSVSVRPNFYVLRLP